MEKTKYRQELLKTVFSLFSPNSPFFASDADNHIDSALKQSYVFKTYLKTDDIQLLYKNGVVTLTGTVADESHKFLAKETIARLPGVAGVYSRLEEKNTVPAVNTDAWLISKIRSTLLLHQHVNVAETEIIAQNGVVILRGEAVSKAQKNLTTDYVKDVEGVKSVKNQMTVSSTVSNAGGKKAAQKMDNLGEFIDDASVSALVRTTLMYHRSTTALHITVETKDGVVKLEGKAGNWAEKNQATRVVIDVPGVKMVFNNITVERREFMASRQAASEVTEYMAGE